MRKKLPVPVNNIHTIYVREANKLGEAVNDLIQQILEGQDEDTDTPVCLQVPLKGKMARPISMI